MSSNVVGPSEFAEFRKFCEISIQCSDPSELEKFLESSKVDVNAVGDATLGLTCLHGVCLNSSNNPSNSIKVVDILINHGANLEAKGFQSLQTPLASAIFSGNLNFIKHLVSKGANPNVVDINGSSLLHCAAQKGNVEAIKYLQEECKVGMNVKDSRGWKPYHVALGYGQRGAVELFLQMGQNVNDPTTPNQKEQPLDPIHILVIHKKYELLQILFEKHSLLINKTTNSILDPLHIAVTNKDAKMVQLLISLGADKTIKTKGFTPIELAKQQHSQMPTSIEENLENLMIEPEKKKIKNKYGINTTSPPNITSDESKCGNLLCNKKETEIGEFKCCSRCKDVYYCSKECQTLHWKEGGHKTLCIPFTKPSQ